LLKNTGNFVKIIDKSTNYNLANVKNEFIQVTDFDKYPILLKFLRENEKFLKQNLSIMIFCNNIACARKTELFLIENGYKTASLHGDIPPLRRKSELEKFKKRTAKILVCTDIASRGLDFSFVYIVINFDFPKMIADYLHRAGRTGRGGKQGIVVSFFRSKDKHLIETIKNSHKMNLPMQIGASSFRYIIYNFSLKNKELENKLPTKKELIKSFRFRKLDKNENILMKKLQKRRKIIEKFKSKTQTNHVKKNKKLHKK